LSDELKQEVVLGAVLLWGRVLIGDVNDKPRQGRASGLRFRAQHGRVLALRREDRWAEDMGAAFGIPLVAEAYLEAFAREHGAQVRAADRPSAWIGRLPPAWRWLQATLLYYKCRAW
jgi:hypothetical protein